MSRPTTIAATPGRGLGRAVLAAGLVAGALDILFAFASAGVGPVRVLQSVASGLLGRAASMAARPRPPPACFSTFC